MATTSVPADTVPEWVTHFTLDNSHFSQVTPAHYTICGGFLRLKLPQWQNKQLFFSRRTIDFHFDKEDGFNGFKERIHHRSY